MSLTTAPEDLAILRNGALPRSLAQRALDLAVSLEQGTAKLRRIGGGDLYPQQRAALLRQDLAEGRVLSSDGNVFWTTPQLLRQLPECRFDGPAPSTMCFSDTVVRRPVPGHHRLYGLPHSGLIVGVESFGRDPIEDYRGRLLAALEIGPSDLASLREGQASPAIVARIARASRKMFIIGCVVVALTILPIGFGVLIGLHWPLFELFGVALGLPILMLPVPAIASTVAFRSASRLGRERHAKILIVEGEVGKRMLILSKNSRRSIEINGELFWGNDQPSVEALYENVVPGWPARGYVTAGTRTLVAMEPLPIAPLSRAL